MQPRRLLAALGVLVLVSTACGSPGSTPDAESQPEDGEEEVTLNLWAYEGYQDFLPAVKAAFEEEYPHITLEITNIPEDTYITKVETALAADSPPDLGFIYERRWIKGGAFLPLDDVIAEQEIDLSAYNEGVMSEGEECMDEGQVYCLGSYTGAVMLFYNKDMFDEAGIAHPSPTEAMTVEEYADLACQLTKPEDERWGTANGDPVTWLPWETVVGEDGKTAMGVVNGETSVQVHDTVAQMMREGCAPTLNVLDPWQQGVDFFAQEQLAMVITDFQSLFKIENAGINYGVTLPPAPAGIEPFFNVWTDSIGVFSASEHPEEAKLFVAFQTTEGQRIRVAETGDVPISAAVAEEVNWAGDVEGRQEALELLPLGRPAVFIPSRWDVVGPLFDAFPLIVEGEKTAQEALDDAAPEMQDNLDRAWETWDSVTGG